METFNPLTLSFTVLPISLPPQLRVGGGSVAFVVDEELRVLTDDRQMLRWKATEREFRISNTEEVMWSNQPPLIVGSMVLIVSCGGVDQFSLDTYSFIKHIR